MAMLIERCACLGSFGHDAAALAEAFAQGTAVRDAESFAANPTDTTGLTEFYPARSLRQCDHFSKLALLAASRTMADTDKAGLGIILASGYGPAMPTFDFIDSLLDHGEAMASPLAFSLSVHNIPAAIVAKTMQISGPCATVCQFESAVASGLLLAEGWLREGRVKKVLFGAVDELTGVLRGITGRISAERAECRAPALRRELPLGEAAAFFLLSDSGASGIGRIDALALSCGPGEPGEEIQADICFASGTPGGENAPQRTLDGSRAYGNVPVAQALDIVLALDLLRRGQGRTALCLNGGSGARSAVAVSGARA